MTTWRERTSSTQHWGAFSLAVMVSWLIVGFLLWVVRGLIDVASTGSSRWTFHLLGTAGFWGVNALLAPLIIGALRVVPFERGRLALAAGWHLLLTMVVPVAHVLIRTAWAFAVLADDPLTFRNYWAAVPRYMTLFLGVAVVMFLATTGATSAWDYFQRYGERARTAAALELERVRLEASLAEARLETLQAQLQPHFLFNALHALSTLILKGDSRAADEMLSHISRFLRMTLDHAQSHTVPLAIELEYLDAYLAIQRARFGDCLQIETTVDDGSRALAVPRLILQPLVENAIKHGVAGEAGLGHIAVRTAHDDGRLILEVEDDGRGPRPGEAVAERVGLGNVRRRLDQLYPARYSFALSTSRAGGFLARIVIPAETATLVGEASAGVEGDAQRASGSSR